MNVTDMYVAVHSPTHQAMALKTVGSMLNKKTRRTAKKRKRERCKIVGNASTTLGRRRLSTPSEKKARIRPRVCGLDRGCVSLIYRRTHCCNNVASKAHVRLMAKLKNQSELTQMAYIGGVKEDAGLRRVEGMETWVPLASASS